MHEKYMEGFFAGDALSASRLMSIVEEGGDEAEEVLDKIFPRVGKAYRIGMTGLTGAGKSSLVNKLIGHYRDEGRRIGVVAVDPTSPFSGGAILGDRIRMSDTKGDEGVFIRSIATRGSTAGLGECADELADVLDAFGSEIIFLETIGVGQLEYRIRFSAHTTVVVLIPEAGDDIQSLKSGLMEVGDVFVVNKADRAHAGRYADDLRSMLKLRHCSDGWCPPVVSTVAIKGEGLIELAGAISDHKKFLEENGRLESKRVESLENRVRKAAQEKFEELFWGDPYIKNKMDEVMHDVIEGGKSPYRAARELVASLSVTKERGRNK